MNNLIKNNKIMKVLNIISVVLAMTYIILMIALAFFNIIVVGNIYLAQILYYLGETCIYYNVACMAIIVLFAFRDEQLRYFLGIPFYLGTVLMCYCFNNIMTGLIDIDDLKICVIYNILIYLVGVLITFFAEKIKNKNFRN